MKTFTIEIMDGGNGQMINDVIEKLNEIGNVVSVKRGSRSYGIFEFKTSIIQFETDVSEEEWMRAVEEVLNRKYSE